MTIVGDHLYVETDAVTVDCRARAEHAAGPGDGVIAAAPLGGGVRVAVVPAPAGRRACSRFRRRRRSRTRSRRCSRPLPSADAPLVLGVGELHQTADTAGIASSLSRFTRKIWPLLAARVSDLVVETWVTDGACGKAEAATVGDVARTTERPAATEDEIVALLARAKASGARPHILKVGCAEYRPARRGPGGGGARQPVDFERMLALIEGKLEAQVTAVLAARPAADAAKLIVVYGGALHNDLHPDPVLAPFSYGRARFTRPRGATARSISTCPSTWSETPAMRAEPWFRPGSAPPRRPSRASSAAAPTRPSSCSRDETDAAPRAVSGSRCR